MKNKFLPFLLLSILSVFVYSCKDNSTNTPTDAKSGLTGTWLVTRTLVTPSQDFPQGYQDQQEWSFTTNGSNATITTKDGSMNGSWTSSQDFANLHWVFEAEGTDYRTGLYIKVVVEITSVSPLKGTNVSYYYDSYNSMWVILDGFTVVGTKIK